MKFKRIGDLSSTNPKTKAFLEKLADHGEVQVKTASGTVYSIHLGDEGYIDGPMLSFRDNTGTCHTIDFEQVESTYTHLGSLEG